MPSRLAAFNHSLLFHERINEIRGPSLKVPSREERSIIVVQRLRSVPLLMTMSPASSCNTAGTGLERIWRKNAKVPETLREHAFDLIARTIARQPKHPAVCAWDGELTYSDLHKLARNVCRQVAALALGPGDLVPVCFEKSLWTSVAILGVVMSGAAFVLLDSSLPERRLQDILQQIKAKSILCSISNRHLASRLVHTEPIVVGPGLNNTLDNDEVFPVERSPCSTAYVAFTSGSTGNSKGCVISHQNLCSGLHHQVSRLGYSTASRVLDFASYSFDLSIHNLFATWAAGGCLCVPSDADRTENPGNCITRLEANFVHLTPTVARLLKPETVPTLETLVLVGEMVTDRDSRIWWGRLPHLINAYGPTECTFYSTFNCNASSPNGLPSIGISTGAVVWVVDANDHEKLLPWSQSGELLIEGPIVGQGYLNRPEQTAAVFIEAPNWLLGGASGISGGRHGRLYKTGDLGRFDEEGRIIIQGRKDTQVKIRGNRVELGEVESRVHDIVPHAFQVVADAVQPRGANDPVLTVFLQVPGASSAAEAQPVRIENHIAVQLAQYLPAYMIPVLFCSVSEMPLTVTGKVDRKILRDLGSDWSLKQMALDRAEEKMEPESHDERVLRGLWAEALGIDQNCIGREDSFFRWGGDSISGMRLVATARRAGITLTLANIFQKPMLKDQSRLMTQASVVDSDHALPMGSSLIDPKIKAAVLSHATSTTGLSPYEIAEILPLTDMQEHFIRDGILDSRQYVDYHYIDLGHRMDFARLQDSCCELMRIFPIIRATFVCYSGRHWAVIPATLDLPFQVVNVDSSLQDGLSTLCLDDIASFGRNQLILRFVLLRHKEQGLRLVMRLSHAQYDAISIGVAFQVLFDLYHARKQANRLQYSAYLAHIALRRDASKAHFEALLDGAPYTDMSTHFMPKHIPTVAEPYRIRHRILLPQVPSDITLASFMSAACALFFSQLLHVDEIVFGRLLNGRNAALPGIDELMGCCINVTPVRCSLAPSTKTLASLVRDVQAQFGVLGDADTFGFSETVRECTKWPQGAGIYMATMHQNVEEGLAFEMEDEFIGRLRRFENDRRLPFFLYIISYPCGNGELDVEIFSHSQMVSPDRAQGLLDQFCPAVERLATAVRLGSCIGEFNM